MTNSLKAFFSREAGQKRRAWLNSLGREEMDYALGPHAGTVRNTANVLNMFNPIEGISEAMQGGRQAVEGEGWDRVQGLGRMSSGIAATVAPVAAGRAAGHGAGQMVDDVFDALVGWNPTRQAVGDEFGRFAGDEAGGIRAYHGSPHDFDEFSMDRTPAQQVSDMLAAGRGDEVTDEMMAAVDPQEMFQLYESGATGMQMPMDEASRMARADAGWPREGYHSTRGDFNEFEKGDVGYHIGTEEQASERLRDTRRIYGQENEVIMPLRYRAENSLATKDAGQWDDPARAGATMQEAGLPVDEIVYEADELTGQFSDPDDWKQSYEARSLLDDLRFTAEAEGYDSIKYSNEAENAYGNLPGMTRAAKAQHEVLNKEWHEIRTAAARRRPELPTSPTDAEMEQWLAYDATPTPAELARMDELRTQMDMIRETGTNDSHSYAVFDAANIRSKFARFDPRLKHLRNLSAVGAGVAMLSQQDKDEIERYLSDF